MDSNGILANCVLGLSGCGFYVVGAQGSQQYDVDAAEIDQPRDRCKLPFIFILHSLSN